MQEREATGVADVLVFTPTHTFSNLAAHTSFKVLSGVGGNPSDGYEMASSGQTVSLPHRSRGARYEAGGAERRVC